MHIHDFFPNSFGGGLAMGIILTGFVYTFLIAFFELFDYGDWIKRWAWSLVAASIWPIMLIIFIVAETSHRKESE